VSEERIADARRAGFYPLMLLLERLQRDRTPVGLGGAPAEEGVRFRHDPSLAFNSSDIAAIARRAFSGDGEGTSAPLGDVYEITTTFLGLTGSVSPLPSYLSEEIAQEEADSTRTREFLDIFHHRLLSLFYRAQLRYDLPNSRLSDDSDAWSRRLLALLGFDETGAVRSGFPVWRVLRMAGLLSDGEITAAALETALTDILASHLGEARVFVEQFVGSWVEVEPAHVTRLGQNASFLGRDLLLGQRVFDRAGKFRVVIGPLTREEYARFAEGGEPLRAIALTISTLQGGALEYEVVLWLSREAAPLLQLTSSGRTRLGKNSWLGGQSREERIRVQVPSV
jgi:type VI secretion system protein ImpH